MSGDPIQVFAVIPAAGQSTRMGRPKQLLPLRDCTMLESVIETVLDGDIDALCVVTSTAIDGELALSEDPRFLTAVNDDPRTQMLDSVLIGLALIRNRRPVRECDAVLVCPGDSAAVTSADVSACTRAYRLNPGSFIVAAFHGKRGHPMALPFSLEIELRAHPEGGIRTLLDRHADHVQPVECASDGVLADIDTPDDYARLQLLQGSELVRESFLQPKEGGIPSHGPDA